MQYLECLFCGLLGNHLYAHAVVIIIHFQYRFGFNTGSTESIESKLIAVYNIYT